MREKQILTLIEASRNVLDDLDALLQKDMDDPVYKRAFIRRMCDLGEALTYFRKYDNDTDIRLHANPLLKEVQDEEVNLITRFTKARNDLLHDYLVEHHNGNEGIFTSALEHFKIYTASLRNALNTISEKDEVKTGAMAYHKINPPPVDMSENTILKYAEYVDKEISEMSDFLEKKKINPEYINSHNDAKYVKFALENYVENTFTLLKAYDGRLNGNPRYFLDQNVVKCFQDLGARFKTFILEAGQSRQNTAHDLQRNYDINKVAYQIHNMKVIRKQYIEPIISYLPNLFATIFEEDMGKGDINNKLIEIQDFNVLYGVTESEYGEKLKLARLGVMNAYAQAFIIDKSYVNKLKQDFNLEYYIESNLTDEAMNFFHEVFESRYDIMGHLFPYNGEDFFLSKKQKFDKIVLGTKKLADVINNSNTSNEDISQAKEDFLKLQEQLTSYKHPNCVSVGSEESVYFDDLFSKSNEEIINGLEGKNVNIKFDIPPKNWSLLHYAVMSNNKNAVKILIERGANPHIYDNDGLDPISYMQNDADPEIKTILKKGKFLYSMQHPFSDDELEFFERQMAQISSTLFPYDIPTLSGEKEVTPEENLDLAYTPHVFTSVLTQKIVPQEEQNSPSRQDNRITTTIAKVGEKRHLGVEEPSEKKQNKKSKPNEDEEEKETKLPPPTLF